MYFVLDLILDFLSPQGPTTVGTGSGTPEVPEQPSTRGYSWATLSPGVINTETWPSRLGVGRGAKTPHHKKTAVTEPQKRGGQGPIWTVGPLGGLYFLY
jgi:hypothetical protein